LIEELKMEMKKAADFISSEYRPVDVPIVYCDLNENGDGYVFYSNRPLKGYVEKSGMYAKEVPMENLSEAQKERMKERFYDPITIDQGITFDIEIDLFGFGSGDIPKEGYIFVPAPGVVHHLTGNAERADYMRRWSTSQILVHEMAHALGNGVKRRLAKRLGTGKGDICMVECTDPYVETPYLGRKEYSGECQSESVAYMAELKYLERNDVPSYEARMANLERNVEMNHVKRKNNPAYSRKITRPDEINPHPSGARLYFSMLKNPQLREDVDVILKTGK
jgi:hypothetical protein